MRKMIVAGVVLVSLALAGAGPARAAQPVAVIDIDGAITPITARLLAAAVERAQAEHAQALVVQLNTPGGLERSMRTMAQTILNAQIPVIVYVAPTGARAASAGVFITMAAHVAAMAPATNIGAAHPVAVSGQMDKEMSKKVANDAAAGWGGATIRAWGKGKDIAVVLGTQWDTGQDAVEFATAMQDYISKTGVHGQVIATPPTGVTVVIGSSDQITQTLASHVPA
jgi:membrane-bound ClpP family serine protease